MFDDRQMHQIGERQSLVGSPGLTAGAITGEYVTQFFVCVTNTRNKST